jgi:hypothetical protein
MVECMGSFMDAPRSKVTGAAIFVFVRPDDIYDTANRCRSPVEFLVLDDPKNPQALGSELSNG